MATVKEQIVNLATYFMGISDPLPFEESRMANYIVAFLTSTPTIDDIKEACVEIGNKYQYVDSDKLQAEINTKLYNTPIEAKTKSAIFILGGLFLGYVIFRKR